jgi:hypothetical protein
MTRKIEQVLREDYPNIYALCEAKATTLVNQMEIADLKKVKE